MKKNGGFSIVELVIVVAIIGILIAVGMGSISYNQRLKAQECAEKITALIEECKLISTSKYETSLIIQNNGSGEIEAVESIKPSAEESASQTISIVGDTSVTISYETTSGGTGNLSEGGSFTINFDRVTGAFDTKNDNIAVIYVEKGGVTKTITLESKTGKVSIE